MRWSYVGDTCANMRTHARIHTHTLCRLVHYLGHMCRVGWRKVSICERKLMRQGKPYSAYTFMSVWYSFWFGKLWQYGIYSHMHARTYTARSHICVCVCLGTWVGDVQVRWQMDYSVQGVVCRFIVKPIMRRFRSRNTCTVSCKVDWHYHLLFTIIQLHVHGLIRARAACSVCAEFIACVISHACARVRAWA